MERLMEDALLVHNLLPWIESDEEIIYFMRRIPIDNSHLRNQLTLRYFIQRNDYGDTFEQNIEDDAREIVGVLPGTPYKDIKERLSILGSIANRKEVVIRQLLHKKIDLDEIINAIDLNVIRKRKSESSENLLDLESSHNEPHIKLKIRKLEGSLQVVSQITQERTSPTKATLNVNEPAEGPTSSVLITSSSNYSEPCNSSVNFTVPSTSTTEIEDPFPEFTDILNSYIDNNKPSTSGTTISARDKVKPASMMSENNNVMDFATTPKNINVTEIEHPKEDDVNTARTEFEKPFNSRSDFSTTPNNIDITAIEHPKEDDVNTARTEFETTFNSRSGIRTFDLIAFVKEISAVSEKIIRQRCKKLNINLHERPSASKLTFLLNDLLDDIVEVPSDSDTDTEEYLFNGNLPSYMEIEENQQGTSDGENKSINLSLNAKKFKLKEPIFNPKSMRATSSTNGPLPEPKVIPPVAPNKCSIIKPSRLFIPDKRQPIERTIYNKPMETHPAPTKPGIEENVIPAMPDMFMELLQSRIPKDKKPERRDFHYTDMNRAFRKFPKPMSNLVEAEGVSNTTNGITDSSSVSAGPSNSNKGLLNISVCCSTTSAVPSTTSAVPSTSSAVPSINSAVPSTISAVPSTTSAVPSTTSADPSTSSADLSTTSADPSNGSSRKPVIEEKLFLRLVEMFPEASPDYLRLVCGGRRWSQFDEVVTDILSYDYPKRPQRPPSPVKEVDLEEQYDILKELLPDADPVYLRMQCEKYTNDDEGLKNFIDRAMEQKDYPTLKDYLRKQQISAQQKQYTTEFNIENFVQLFPDPSKTFNDPNRTINIDDTYSRHYITLFFRNKFDKLPARYIQCVLDQCSYKVMPSHQKLLKTIANKIVLKTRRKPVPLPENIQNIPLLQELAYLNHKEEIEDYLQKQQKKKEQDRLEAKQNGIMQTCQCCYDDEVMPQDIFVCPNGCMFCKDCIKRSCEVALGAGKTAFACLADCSTEFSLQTLQTVLPPKMFSKLAQKKALAEIKAAGIEELETCPFCDFASIPNEGDRIFRCLNPDCMKESCRTCREPNHVPLKCEEVEKDEDVKARTYVEDRMSEALIRKCWKCGLSFFKEEGCNKMTCSCGAQMCYLCKEPIKDYTHFNGIGGDKFHLCPLYSDTNLINQQAVLTAANAAKAEIDPSKLKVDPTADVVNHYKRRKEKLPREPHMDLLNRIPQPGIPQGHHHRHQQQHVLRQGQMQEMQRILLENRDRLRNMHHHN